MLNFILLVCKIHAFIMHHLFVN